MPQRSLWSRFSEKARFGLQAECWIWAGAVNSAGYGLIRLPDGSPTTAHRVAWELYHSDVPLEPGRHVRHTCGTKLCVNPAHLYLGEKMRGSKALLDA